MESGRIDIISNVYMDASKELSEPLSFHVSSLNFLGSSILELVPESIHSESVSAAHIIKDTLFRSIKGTDKGKRLSVYEKKSGALFLKDRIPNYDHRVNLSDTLLFKKRYKRFEVRYGGSFSRYYVLKTDTILPYSLYGHVEKAYGGRIERIDSYDPRRDIFVTTQLFLKQNWDERAKDLWSEELHKSLQVNK